MTTSNTKPRCVPATVMWSIAALVLCSTVVGCNRGPYELAPVSGVVTLDGQPLENAAVRFAPQLKDSGSLVGPGSMGITDAEGRYSVRTHSGEPGAVVGAHVVSVSTYDTRLVDPKNSDKIEVLSKERIPRRYRSPSELTVNVPSGGAENVEFQLTSK